MNCPSALICSRYADGALPQQEADELALHLAACESCHQRVLGFAADSNALRLAMQAAEVGGVIPAFVPRPTIPGWLTGFGWLALAIWSVSVAWMSLSNALTIPAWLGWIAPDVTGLGVDLIMSLIVGLAAGSGEVLNRTLEPVGSVLLIAAGLSGLWLLLRRKIQPATTVCLQLGLVTILLTAATPGHAFELRRDDDRVTVPAGETIDDTLIVAAERVLIEGDVTGDLIVIGEQVTLRGSVGGLLIAFAETLNLEGEVTGSVLGVGETVDVRGAPFGANLYVAGKEITLEGDTTIAGNMVLAAGEADVRTQVGRDLLSLAQHLLLTGNVGGNLWAYGEQVELADSARIEGDLTARVVTTDDLQVASGAVIVGNTDLSTWPEQPSRYATFEYYLGQLVRFLGALVTGLVLFQLFPALMRTRLDTGTEWFTTAAFGALALVATPVLAAIAAFTLIGAPLGILAFLLWLIALYSAGIVAAGHVGRLLLNDESRGQALPLAAGLALLFVLINIPLLGGAVRLLAVVLGLGLIVQWLRGLWLDRAG